MPDLPNDPEEILTAELIDGIDRCRAILDSYRKVLDPGAVRKAADDGPSTDTGNSAVPRASPK